MTQIAPHLMYKNVTDDAKYDSIIPTAAKVPPISVTVRYEYFTDNMLEMGPATGHNHKKVN